VWNAVNQVALEQVYIRAILCSPVNYIPTLLNIPSAVIGEWAMGQLEDEILQNVDSPHYNVMKRETFETILRAPLLEMDVSQF
jgi:hypothetical protein